ncbi:MAG: LysM peptidoglycan-binding domain-containing protein [Spirochaetales bacterium]|nr:LysM peptidoglycan-binding domain-containing protein [Spirochaetales bacterium]
MELVLALDEEGSLSATAADRAGGGRKSVTVQLGAIPAGGPPEFELEPEGPSGGSEREPEGRGEDLLTGETYPIGPGDRRKEHLHRRKRRPLLLAAFVVLALLLIAAIAFVVFRSVDGGRIPQLLGSRQAAESAAQADALLEETPGAQAGEAGVSEIEVSGTEGSETGLPETAVPGEGAAEASSAAVSEAEKKTPASAPAGGVWYEIKRGDTLWDIAATYYRNPWLYPRLARANEIVNPDLIFAGSKLFVPEP